MGNIPKTREEAMARFMAAKARKKARIAEMERVLKINYEQRTGQKPDYVFSM